MAHAIHIRPTRMADAAAVAAVLADGKAALAKLGISQWQNGPYPSYRDVVRDIEQGISYLAEDNGTVLGTMALSFDGDSTYDVIEGAWLTASTTAHPRYATLHRTAVAHAARRRGVMRALIDEAACIARSQGAESLRIDTHPGNTPMRALLERCGFAACGTIYLAKDDPEPERIAYEKLV